MFRAEFNRISGKEGPRFSLPAQGVTADPWLGLLGHQEESAEKNGTEPVLWFSESEVSVMGQRTNGQKYQDYFIMLMCFLFTEVYLMQNIFKQDGIC